MSYNGYYVTFPRLRQEFDSPHPHHALIRSGDNRDLEGKYTPENQEAQVTALTEYIGSEKLRRQLERKGTPLRQRIEVKRAARLPGSTQIRYYDRIVQAYDGSWVGIEIKYRSAQLRTEQQAFDERVTPDNPAKVILDNGDVITITKTRTVRVTEADIPKARKDV